MSIANEISRLQTSKADTKEQVNIDKDYINAGIDFIGSETVDDYDEKIQEMQEAYKAFIPVNTTSDTQIDAPKGGAIIGKTLKGNTSQSGTPTPSAPVAIENATGLQKIKVTKKNLFDVSTLVNKSYNGASSSTRICNSQAIYLTPGTYTFSTNINTSTYEFKTDVLENPPTSPITESYIYNSGFGTSNPRTITITSPGYFAILIKKNDNTGINDFTLKEFTYQLEKGSSATTYEEYQDTTLYMNYNKNLLKINDTSKTINGITFTENSDGSIHAEGTATDLALYGTNTLLPILPSQRYRLSGCPEGGSLSSYYISIMLKNESGSSIGSFADIGDGVFGDFIAPDNARYMYAQILILSGTTINATFYPQLELGSEITPYKEYEPLQEGNYEINLGKNLLDLNLDKVVNQNGITYSVESDGTITINGTATAQTDIGYLNNQLKSVANKKYSLNFIYISGTLNGTMNIFNQDGNNSWKGFNIDLNGTGALSNTSAIGSYTMDLNMQGVRVIRVKKDAVINNLKFKLTFVQSSIADYNYSPYFTPIELNKIGNYQDYIRKGTGKNLFDNNADIVEGYTFGATDNLISDSRFFYQSSYIPVLPNTSYCIKKPSGSSLRICEYQQDKTFIQRDYEKYVFTTTANTYFIRISDFTAVKDLIQLEQGTSATFYEPYACTGKNLFDSSGEIKEDWFGGSGITYSIDNGVYTLNGTNTRQYIYLRYNVELEAGNYFFSGCPSGGSGSGYGAFVRVGSTNYWDFGNGVTFNIPTKQEVLVYPVRIGSETITANNLVFKPMIKRGTIATSFEPYIHSTTKDKWYIEKNIGKAIVNGSESCSRQVLTGDIVRFMFTGKVEGIDGARQTIFSNYFVANLNSANDREGIGFVYGNLLYLYKQEASVADFQTWLNTHNTSVYYALNTPEYTLIENEDLIDQLEKIMPLLEGQNNISVDGSIPVYMDLDYIVKADKYLIGNRREGK
jgi:hypothetical protein